MHYSTILVAVGLATQGAAECSRGMLQKATAAYGKYITKNVTSNHIN